MTRRTSASKRRASGPIRRPFPSGDTLAGGEGAEAAAHALAQVGRELVGTLDLDRVTQLIVNAVLRLLNSRNAALYQRDSDSGALRCVAFAGPDDPRRWVGMALPLGHGVVGRAVVEGRTIWSPDFLADPTIAVPEWLREQSIRTGHRSVIGMPLKVRGETIGGLGVGDAAGRVVTDAELRLLGAFADQAALALENARLYEQSERRRREAEVLYADQEARAARLHSLSRLSQVVSSSLEVEVVLAAIGRAAATLMEAPVVSIWIADEAGQTLDVRAFLDDSVGGGFPVRQVSVGQGLIGWVARHRVPLDVADVLGDGRSSVPDWWRAHGLTSFYGLPVLHEGALIGVLALNGRRPFQLGPDDRDLLDTFAAQAAVAIRNSQLFAREQAARAAVQASEAGFRLLFHNNPLPMWVYDTETLRFLEVNDAAITHYGYSRDEFLRMRITEIRPPDDVSRLRETLEQIAVRDEAGVRRSGPWRHRVKDGRVLEVEVISHQLEFGGRLASLVVVEDVTERRALEQQVRQLQKMEAVGQLAGGVAHDFNNLLTVITGRSALLALRLPAEDPGRRDVDIIHKTAERAARLTGQLLAFSRKQVLQPRVLDLNEVLSGLAPMLQRLIGEDVELAFAPGADLGQVSADPGQVEQVVLNLVVNARDAMARGGRVTIETANVELDEAYAGGHVGVRPGPHVMLAVSDTGCGMDAATQARIFEPFFTTKEPGKGTGLGLATVYGIVKQSGGDLGVYSEPGRGATFKIYLPRVEPTAQVAAPGAAVPAALRGAETILLVEDEEEIRALAREILEGYGYTLLVAHDAGEALLIAERHLGPIHLLVTDVVMPKMSGRDLAKALAPARPETRVLYASGYTDSAIVRHGVLGEGIDFIQKPFTPEALGRKVREVLDTN